MLKPLVDEALERCRLVRVLGDRGYDTRASFNYLDGRKIDVGIRVRSTQIQWKAVVERMDYRRWRSDKSYGYRWMASQPSPP
ncbi:MAG: transposase [Candidatus Caldarchaeum sp.]